MKQDLIDEIEERSIKAVKPFIWSMLGIAVIITGFLLANGIHLGTIVNRHIDILQKEREQGIRDGVHIKQLESYVNQLESAIESQGRLVQRNSEDITILILDNEILKENSHPPAQ